MKHHWIYAFKVSTGWATAAVLAVLLVIVFGGMLMNDSDRDRAYRGFERYRVSAEACATTAHERSEFLQCLRVLSRAAKGEGY